jgi:vacuolar protein sorting-associated protein 13A/C
MFNGLLTERLTSVELINDSASLATLVLSTADVAIFLRPTTVRIAGRLGNLALVNGLAIYNLREEFNQMLSIEGKNFAEFAYQTETLPSTGFSSSSFTLNAASLKFFFLEQPLHNIYAYLNKLAKLKGIYDAATQVAAQSAPDIGHLRFEITIKSPIIVIPSDPSQSGDVLVMRLGEIDARNKSDMKTNTVSASLRGIQLVSSFSHDEEVDVLKMIDDIDIKADAVQTIGLDRSNNVNVPDTQVSDG